jgi:hypothetical protein
MKISLLYFYFFLGLNQFIFSKNDSLNLNKRNIIYVEAGGVGGYGSLNYERLIITKIKTIFLIRIGLSTYNIYDYTNNFNPDLLVPLIISGTNGQKHKLEYGLGITISNIVQANQIYFNPERVTNIHTIFNIGYRYHNINNGFMFRLTYTPILVFNKYFQNWAGISFGFSFK